MNESARRFMETAQPGAVRFFLIALWGILLGYFVLLIFQLPLKFTYYLIAGPVILFIAISTGRFKRFFQGVLIFIIPIDYATHFFRRPYLFGEKGLDFSPLDIVLIVLYALWFYELLIKKTHHFRPYPQITIPGLSLVGMALLSMIQAQDPYLALFEAIQILKAVLLYLYVANHVQNKKDVSFVLVIMLVGLFLQSAIAMAQRWLGVSLGLHLFGEYRAQTTFTLTHDYYLTVARVGGTIGHPNNLAKYVELLIPLSMVLLFTKIKLRTKLASGAVFISAFIVLLVTLSRGGWLCFLGSMVLIFIFIFRARLISVQTLVAIALVVLLLGGIAIGFSGLVTNRLFSDDYGSAWNRIPLNRLAMIVTKHHPVIGVGAKNYWKVMDFYSDVNIPIVNLVHNAYLLKAAEMGIPGLLIFLWLLAAIFLQGLKNLRMKDIFLVCLNIGILAGLAALWAHWLVDPGYIGRVPSLWVMAGLIMASKKVYRDEVVPQTLGAEVQVERSLYAEKRGTRF